MWNRLISIPHKNFKETGTVFGELYIYLSMVNKPQGLSNFQIWAIIKISKSRSCQQPHFISKAWQSINVQ